MLGEAHGDIFWDALFSLCREEASLLIKLKSLVGFLEVLGGRA